MPGNLGQMSTDLVLTLGATVLCGGCVIALVGPVRRWLIARGIYDTPSARSSHTTLKPRGGGIALLAVVLPAWLIAGWLTDAPPWALTGLTALLAVLSFVDDVRGLSAAVRLPIHGAAVAAGLIALDPPALVPTLLPGWLDVTVTALAWLWFVNLYNFMDGIDGITGVQTVAVAAGLGAVALVVGDGVAGAVLPWLLAGGAAGFLWWNWAPARVFLGDVGAVPLGFALGWLLLDLAATGYLVAALILPGYYLVDATVTLARRLLRGARVWRPHKEHAYQRAVQRGLCHSAVARRVAAADLLLVACALWAATGAPGPAAVVAGVIAGGLWLGLAGGRRA